MILIVSENNERTTTEVIKWLIKKEKKFIRIHEEEKFSIQIINKNFFLKSDRNQFFINEIKSVWFRRGGLRFQKFIYNDKGINEYMYEHQYWIEDYVRNYFENNIRRINKEEDYYINKLIVLDKAKEQGLKIPEFFLAENTDDVLPKQYITKTLTGNGEIRIDNKSLRGSFYTTVITRKEKKNFFPSFFQEKIEKDFEIRTFYLDGKCWSMAIFSQKDEQTKVDYRIYNESIPNRNIPYRLPLLIEKKIERLMKSLKLNCGSIDFIKQKDEYFFLEVNPIGQFGNVSTNCNYNLAEKIAEYL